MKKFFVKITIFGVVLFALAYMVDMIISTNLQKSKRSDLITWNKIFDGNMHHDALILGNSRAMIQFNPLILDSILNIDSYNLGMASSQILRQIFQYNLYCKLNEKPKLIIHSIDIGTMGQRVFEMTGQFLPYFTDKSFKKEIVKWEPFALMDRYFPAYRYMGHPTFIVEGLTMNKIAFRTTPLIKGHNPQDLTYDGRELRKHTVLEYRHDPLALQLFDQHLANAQKDSVKVVFVYAPVYIGATEKVDDINGMYQMYDSISRKYNIPILDYMFDPISYDTTYFYNSTHLNRLGADLFTTKLAHDIDSLKILK